MSKKWRKSILSKFIPINRPDEKVNVETLASAIFSHGGRFITGVPDSNIKNLTVAISGLCNIPTNEYQHIIAANEGSALALGIGNHLATGSVPIIYLQNSGIGNLVNPLLSLAHRKVYSIPMVLIVGWRGDPYATNWKKKDEPQHQVQGEVT